ncbi:MAG TPA: tetratricopeptide repeat protein, partial [Flavobacteriales bacterium]|nr:tetratricopeptide repeat protein [Flavobacteriales bacterium]
MRILTVCVLANALAGTTHAQDYKAIEKYKYKIEHTNNDTVVINMYQEIFWEYYGVYNDTALMYAKKAISFSEKKSFIQGLIDGYRLAGMAYSELSNYPEALRYEQMALKKCDPKEHLERKANILNNMANIHYELKDYNTALSYYQASLDICQKLKIQFGVSSCLGNMGNIYKRLNKVDAALKYYKKSLSIDKEIGNPRGYANSLGNIGQLYLDKKDYGQAIHYFNLSLRVRDSIGLTEGIASSYLSLGNVYLELNDASMALDYFSRALSLAEESNTMDQQQLAYEGQYNCYRKMGRITEALNAFEKSAALKDSVLNEKRTDEVNQLKTSYIIEQKESEYKIQREKDKIKSDSEKKQQRIILYCSIGGLALTIVFLYFIFKRYRHSLKQQKIIEEQKKLVEIKNKEITDSINYAKRIQEAMLTSEQEFTKNFKKAFVYFRPKDIVSGDFYWVIEEPGTNTVLFVLGDCTGHGVPGGFMSVLGINLMNEIVNERRVYEPAQILNVLRERIKQALKQDGAEGTSRDGMDITIGKLNRDTCKFTYATANRMLYIYKNNNLERFSGNKMPVGYFEQEEEFVQYEVQLEKGNYIYFFTDGYVDQIGGDLGRKLKYPNFEAALKKAVHDGRPLDK